jgi:hypothetical protein
MRARHHDARTRTHEARLTRSWYNFLSCESDRTFTAFFCVHVARQQHVTRPLPASHAAHAALTGSGCAPRPAAQPRKHSASRAVTLGWTGEMVALRFPSQANLRAKQDLSHRASSRIGMQLVA